MFNGHLEAIRTMLVFVSCVCLLTNLVNGLPNGAPESACATLVPHHSAGSIQRSFPPYEILAVPGQGRVRVTLGSSQGLPYEGFLIVARDVETGEYVGEFDDLPNLAKVVECLPGLKNGVTHTNSEKKHNLQFEWRAPADYEGTIIFNSTFVQDYATCWVGVETPKISLLKTYSTFAQDYATYWVGVETPRISLLKRSIDESTILDRPISSTPRYTTPPYYVPPVYNNNSAAAVSGNNGAFYESCGETKNCFGQPVGCIKDRNCIAAVSLFVRGDQYLFELMAQKSKYVAVGLSKDSTMGDDSVVECTNEGGIVKIYMSYNEGKHNTRVKTPEGAIKLLESSIRDDIIKCRFTRAQETTVDGRKYDLAREAYNLLLAAGSSLKAQGVGYHDVAKIASSNARILADIDDFVTASDILIRIHGALMLASWIGTASVGILLARYYKQTWVNSPLCGKDQWFAWHRFFMVLTWSMTLAAFVVIFVELGEWSSATIHASLGLATTILCFIQPFMAAIRPHPGTPKRSLFNWAHWFVGNAAHICAIIAIFFAVRLTKANLPEWLDWVLVAYVVFHVLSHLVLTFAGCASDRHDSQRISAFPMKDMHGRTTMGHPDVRRDAPHSSLRQSIFGIYVFVIAAFAIVLIVITVLAPVEDTWNSIFSGNITS